MSALKKVIITLPRGIVEVPRLSATNLARHSARLNFTAVQHSESVEMDSMKMMLLDEDSCSEGSLFREDHCLRGKKRRLDHLTWEEKLQRKKLKNRVAAQTSRDRKKAKLDELEETVRILRDRNDELKQMNKELKQECTMLKSQNQTLVTENKELRKDMSLKSTEEQPCSMCQSRVSCAAPSLGSAASPLNPLPQGGVAQLAPSLALTPPAATLWRILTLYLLSKNCLTTSKETITSSDLKNWPKAFCERLPPKWKRLLINQINKSQSRKIPSKNITIQQEWWGRHQKMWKPVEAVEV